VLNLGIEQYHLVTVIEQRTTYGELSQWDLFAASVPVGEAR
jgi:hypothetical protein